MDDTPLIQLIPVGVLVVLAIRFALGSLERAEAGFASLFVPTDRTMPWPRGVQESDAPWGWQRPAECGQSDARDERVGGEQSIEFDAAIDPRLSGHAGRFVTRPRRVDPIHVRTLLR